MHYFTEHGDTHAEVLAKVRSKYGSGPEVLISQQREVPVKSIWGKITRSTRWEIHGAILEKNKVQPKKKDETIDNKLKLLEEMLNRTSLSKKPAPDAMVDAEDIHPLGERRFGAGSAQAQLTREIQPSLRKEILPISIQPPSTEAIRRLEAEVAELKAQLKSKGGPELDLVKERELLSLYEHLTAMGFSHDFSTSIAMRTRAEIPSTDYKLRKKIHAKAREILGEHVRTTTTASQRIITLVGPTGAGKTTTLVKLAARLSVTQKRRVELITIDNYRIAATEQLKVYARIMDIPCRVCRTPEELAGTIADSSAEFILIDTSGSSPANRDFLNRQKLFFEAIGAQHEIETHLVVPATTRLEDAKLLFDRFELFDYAKVIISKIDESFSFAPIVEMADTWHKPFSLLTNGQDVAKDWLDADRMLIADALLKKWLDETDTSARK
ncbi:MAG: flagellar biosynthesis protein FlhF [Spirochaetes bacterium]|nr:flagellar biosynthesis protein FlhF [Spirochaetota bacterium]MBX3720663.1 flagellar biosynthesis protein FlhF [Turneriella sp.]